MKVGIITLNGYHNFGNKLQNYALEQIILNYTEKVETLFQRIGQFYSPENNNSFYALYKKAKKLKIDDSLLINYIYEHTHDFSHKIEKIEQFIAFKNFSENHLHEVDHIILGNQMKPSVEQQYDYFIVGSDQVWNPQWIEKYQNCLLGFTSKHKKLSYAPSFGVSALHDDEKRYFGKYIKDISYLSVREFAGADIIEQITGKDVPVLLDPTLLLKKKDWDNISKVHKNKPQKPYILTYILGEYTTTMLEDIKLLKEKHHLEVVNLRDLNTIQYYSAGPAEFIDYIKDSTILLTDSFHGVVFANIFEKDYVVYDRVDSLRAMNSRIETLDKFFDIRKNFRSNMESIGIDKTDYKGFKTNLPQLQKDSWGYLDKMFLEITGDKTQNVI